METGVLMISVRDGAVSATLDGLPVEGLKNVLFLKEKQTARHPVFTLEIVRDGHATLQDIVIAPGSKMTSQPPMMPTAVFG